jgi:cyclic beta-1,2-glucan synthetase
MLATLSACDLGYVTPLGLCARLRGAFDSLARLERHRGHFLNWYSTRDLTSLRPAYVSTVDSGNLACCLLALAGGLHDTARTPVAGPALRAGLGDTLDVLAEVLASLPETGRSPGATEQLARLSEQLATLPGGLFALLDFAREAAEETLPSIRGLVTTLVESASPALEPEAIEEIHTWVERAGHHLHAVRRYLATIAPWLLPARAAGLVPGGTHPDLAALLDDPPSLSDIEERARQIEAELARASGLARGMTDTILSALETARFESGILLRELAALADLSERTAEEMDFTFLYDRRRDLFRIGYDVDRRDLDPNCYDLLASEARLASLFAIAKGDAPPHHWLHLGRPCARAGRLPVLLSWGGSMFEYLMPLLLTRCPERSLLHLAGRSAVRRQMAHARKHGMPWGVSESGYYAFDALKNYQYRSFGVPGLGLRRGLAEDRVVTPYASVLALPLFPHETLSNLAFLVDRGLYGPLGFYEALDLTPARTVGQQRGRVVRSFMAHHQGMIFVSLANCLGSNAIVERFHRHPRIRTVAHLLFEQVPTYAPVERYPVEKVAPATPSLPEEHAAWTPGTGTDVPFWHLLSNGRLHVLLDNSGAGVSRWRDLDLTRFSEDSTLAPGGSFVYLKDLVSGELSSATPEPTGPPEPGDEVVFTTSSAEFRRRALGISSRLEITVAAEEDAEIRRLALVNETDRPRRLLVAFASEPILAPRREHVRHPAFVRLFLEFEWLPDLCSLLCRRRSRSPGDAPVTTGMTVAVNGLRALAAFVETDRDRFIGRGRTFRRPAAFEGTPALGGAEARPLDPVMVLAVPVNLPAFGRAEVVFAAAVGERRREVLGLLDRYTGTAAVSWAFTGARRRAAHLFRDAGLAPARGPALNDLLAALVTPVPALRAPPALLAANHRSQAGLWPHGISGDRPIVLAEIRGDSVTPVLLELVRLLALWRFMGFETDLVLLDHRAAGYVDPLRNRLLDEFRRVLPEGGADAAASLFLVRSEGLDDGGRTLLFAAARAVLRADGPPLSEQLRALRAPRRHLPRFAPTPLPADLLPGPPLPLDTGELLFDNGLGGFTPHGREYVIRLGEGQRTPAPWVNVVGRPGFGFLVSESGSGATWAVNSGENRLTPWSNDPVSDPAGEALYLRDEESARVWSPAPGPAPGRGPVEIRHGAGYSVFRRRSEGLDQELRVFAEFDDPVKFWTLRLTNRLDRPRRITVTFYVEWVLGPDRQGSQQYIVPEFDRESGALLARNPFSMEFGERVAFAAASRDLHGLTADRAEFLGVRGDRARPAGLLRVGLSGRVEAGVDACAALQVHLDIPGEATTECHFLLGQGRDRAEAVALARRYRDPGAARAAWHGTREGFDRLLDTVQVSTPDPALDLMLNRWFLYETVSARVFGRTGFYQSSGAFGFRDQLQDVLALLFAAPKVARAHLLEAARHQFEEGDVLHWWHPPSGRGVRTRCSDDLLWLPYTVAAYVSSTGDRAVLDELLPYLAAPPLREDEDERYEWFRPGHVSDDLYGHCLRALEHGWRPGPHGLPLMGTGDWNDGMNRLGRKGVGESVWLAWFLIATLRDFAAVARERGDHRRADGFEERARGLARTVEETAWDGEWYLRAFTDEGEPVGTAAARVCRIDAISQAARDRPWPPWRRTSSGPTTGWCSSSPRRSTGSPGTWATSAPIRPASARMEGSTRTPRPGWASRTPRSATGTSRPGSSAS